MKVNCEKCGASYDIEDQQIPDEGLAMKCPSCLGSFRVHRSEAGAEANAAPGDGAELDLGSVKFFIRRHTGSVFGPFAGTAIQTMATGGKLDGSEDISPDNETWTHIAEHPAFASLFAASAAEPGEAQADLPAPKPAAGTGAAPPKAPKPIPPPAPKPITPPAHDLPDLPAPKTAAGMGAAPPKAPKAPKPITPPAHDLPDLPTPKTAAAPGPALTPAPRAPKPIAPPPPDLPDLPAPKTGAMPGPAATSTPRAPKPIAPPPPDLPDLPDLPTPAENLPTPKTGASPGPGSIDLPDLPTPAENLPTPKTGSTPGPGSIGLPDLPTPAENLPTPKTGASPGPGSIDLPDLPTPAENLPTPAENLPTPTLGEASDSLSYGEVDLESGQSDLPGGEAPLDLSELDLVSPKQGPAEGTPALQGLDLEAPDAPFGGTDAADDGLSLPALETGPEPAVPGDESPREKAAKDAPRKKSRKKPAATKASGATLLGLPRTVAIAIIAVVGVAVVGGAAYVFWPKGSSSSQGGASRTAKPSTPHPTPNPGEKVEVTHLPAMDLDTSEGYREAARALRKRLKQHRGNAMLRAARAKAWLCVAYRFQDQKLRKRALALLKKVGDDTSVEALKARALRALLRGKHQRARNLLKQAKTAAKDDAEVPLFQGWVALASHRPKAAEKAFRRALTLRRESAAARFGLVQALARRDHASTREERLKQLREILKLSKHHAEARVALLIGSPPADQRRARKDLRARIKWLETHGTLRERSVLQYGVAGLLLHDGKLDRALATLGRVSKAFPTDPRFLEAEGRAQLAAGNYETARARLEAARKVRPRSASLLDALVRADLGLGKIDRADQAIIEFEQQLGLAAPAGDKPSDPDEAMAPRRHPRKRKARKHARKRRRRKAKAKAKAHRRAATPAPFLLAQGRVAEAHGDRKKAKRFYLQATSRAPSFTAAHAAYLGLLLEQHRYEGMKSVLDILRPRYGDALPWRLSLVEGRMALAQGRAEAARGIFRKALDRHPGANPVALDLALCLWRSLKKPEEAFLLLEIVYRRARSMTRAVKLIAEYHLERRDFAQGAQRYVEAEKINHSAALARAHALYLLNRPTKKHLKQAEALLLPLLKKNSHDDATTAILALLELHRGQLKQAQKRIQRALILRPGHGPYLRYLARIDAASGNPRRAVQIYDQLLKKAPKNRSLLTERTRIQCHYRDSKGCLAGAKTLIALGPSAEAYVFQGLALLQKRRAARAIRAFRKAVAQDRHNAHAHFMLGRTQYDEAQFRQAISSLRRSLELAEDSRSFWPDIHYFLGMAYLKVRSNRLAQKHLELYLRSKGNPINPETGIQRKTASDELKRL